MSSADLSHLKGLLDRVADQGRTIAVWWRDDDVTHATPALDRLLALAEAAACPLALAAIPARLHDSLPERLAASLDVSVLAHGYAHADHAGPGAKRSEYPTERHAAEVRSELRRARARLIAAFGRRSPPVLVPPWNRISPAMVRPAAEAGFAAISVFGPVSAGFASLNTHVDPVDWRGARSLVEGPRLHSVWGAAIAGGGPVGLLTHHLMFDELLWHYTASLLDCLSGHPAVTFASVNELLPPSCGAASNRDRPETFGQERSRSTRLPA